MRSQRSHQLQLNHPIQFHKILNWSLNSDFDIYLFNTILTSKKLVRFYHYEPQFEARPGDRVKMLYLLTFNEPGFKFYIATSWFYLVLLFILYYRHNLFSHINQFMAFLAACFDINKSSLGHASVTELKQCATGIKSWRTILIDLRAQYPVTHTHIDTFTTGAQALHFSTDKDAFLGPIPRRIFVSTISTNPY